MLTKDKKAEIRNLHDNISRIYTQICSRIDLLSNDAKLKTLSISSRILSVIESLEGRIKSTESVLKSLNPENVLKNGYAILRGKVEIGSEIEITTHDKDIAAKVTNIRERK
jgi:exonuclease VII large subunit